MRKIIKHNKLEYIFEPNTDTPIRIRDPHTLDELNPERNWNLLSAEDKNLIRGQLTSG